MKVRMKVDISGARDGQSWPARGETADLPDEEAASLCASGMAEPVTADDVETATPPDDAEARVLTTETAAAVTPSQPAAPTEPQAPTKKAAPAKKTAAKKTAAPAPQE
jgi:topoisomerase IA-like protein